jgi:hypothetical protein
MVMRKRLVVIIFALACLTSAFFVAGFSERWKNPTVFAATDHPSNSIWIDPSVVNVTDAQVGRTFRVIVWVQNVSNIGAWQVYMEFNDSIVNVTKWIEPATDSHYIFYGKTTQAVQTPPDASYVNLSPGKGRIQVAAVLQPTPPQQQPGNGTGMLCTIEYEVLQVPPKDEQTTCQLDINATDTYMLDPDGVEVQNVTKYGATVYIERGAETTTGFLGLDWWVWATIAVIIIVLVVGAVLVWYRRKK